MKISSFTNYMAAYPERIIFLVCLIVVIIVCSVYYLGSREDPMVAQIMDKLSRVKTVLEHNPAPAAPEIAYLNKIKATWDDVASGSAGAEWLMYREPVSEVVVIPDVVPGRRKINLPPIVKGEKNNEEPDIIILTWEKDKKTEARENKYKIYRQLKGEKIFKLAIELAVSAISSTENGYAYTDKELTPETEYAYYVTSYSEDPEADKKESDPSNLVKLTTPIDYKIDFASVENNELVYTKIQKYFEGKWQPLSYNIRKGESIGKDKFSTGCIISDIQPYETVTNTPLGLIKKKTFNIIYIDKHHVQHSYIIP